MCTGTPLEDPEEQQPGYRQLWEGASTPPKDHYNVAYLIFYIQVFHKHIHSLSHPNTPLATHLYTLVSYPDPSRPSCCCPSSCVV